MKIRDRKHCGEYISSLENALTLKSGSTTMAMGTNSRQLKSRLRNMIYSSKVSKNKQIISLFVGILILVAGFTTACRVLPDEVTEENNSFVVYIKEGGLYYSYLDGGDEISVHEGKDFAYPLISKSGNYIAYTKDKNLYIYDIKDGTYEKIIQRQDIFDNFYDWIDDEIVYSTDESGFTIYNPLTKEKREHIDEHHYGNFKSSSRNLLYGKQTKKWSIEDRTFMSTIGLVEIDLNNYDKNKNKFRIETMGSNFDFMPISIPGDGVLFCRLQGNGYGKLIKIMDGREDIIADNIKMNYFTTDNMDVFINKETEVYETIYQYMKERSIETFSPYYELLDFQISNYVEELIDGNIEATFYYKIIEKNYDKDPDTVEYIREAKESGNKNYQQMYDEYLAPREMNFHFKILISRDDMITLYSNVSPVGVEWEETEMSDFILKR